MNTYKIAVIAGDGIGPEVIDEGVKVLKEAASLDGSFTFEFELCCLFQWRGEEKALRILYCNVFVEFQLQLCLMSWHIHLSDSRINLCDYRRNSILRTTTRRSGGVCTGM